MKCKYASVFLFLVLFSACNEGPMKQTKTDSSNNWAMLGFEKVDSVNPVLEPSIISIERLKFLDPILKRKIEWEDKDVFNPAIVVKKNGIYMFYRAQDKIGKPDGTSRIGLAISYDGLNFKKLVSPIFFRIMIL